MLKRFQADWIKGALFCSLGDLHHFVAYFPNCNSCQMGVVFRPYRSYHSRGIHTRSRLNSLFHILCVWARPSACRVPGRTGVRAQYPLSLIAYEPTEQQAGLVALGTS